MKFNLAIFIYFLLLTAPAIAGKGDKDKRPFGFGIYYTTQPMLIDGMLDEEVWSMAEVSGSFVQQFPDEGSPATENTEVRMVYDDDFLYISAIMYETTKGPNIVSSLKRDFRFEDNDAFAVILGPYDDGNNGFFL